MRCVAFSQELLNAWKRGQTGVPLVDANMRELAATGALWMSQSTQTETKPTLHSSLIACLSFWLAACLPAWFRFHEQPWSAECGQLPGTRPMPRLVWGPTPTPPHPTRRLSIPSGALVLTTLSPFCWTMMLVPTGATGWPSLAAQAADSTDSTCHGTVSQPPMCPSIHRPSVGAGRPAHTIPRASTFVCGAPSSGTSPPSIFSSRGPCHQVCRRSLGASSVWTTRSVWWVPTTGRRRVRVVAAGQLDRRGRQAGVGGARGRGAWRGDGCD